MLEEYINIGFIQTVVEGSIAWPAPGPYKMSRLSEVKVWGEIKKGFIDLLSGYERPHLIIIPELSVPHGYENDLKRLSSSSGAVVIAGLDFFHKGSKVSNRAIVIIPNNWPLLKPSRSTSSFYFGKTFYSKEEQDLFKPENLISNPDIYILDAGRYGVMGIAICSDFFDIERFVVYKGRIQHLIIISHNKDTDSYYFLAEAISRLVYCNVAICNTGEYGDSIAFSPYQKSYERIVYRHKGAMLYSSQLVSLPVKSLDDEQKTGAINAKFKSRPPGYEKKRF